MHARVRAGACRWRHAAHGHADVPHTLTSFKRMRQGKSVRGRVLVLADGATSRMAMQMGYCTEPPKGVCSRAYVEGGTHNADFDGAAQGFVCMVGFKERRTCNSTSVEDGTHNAIFDGAARGFGA